MGIVVAPDGKTVRTSSSQHAAIREAITDVTRQIEDINWVNLSTDRVGSDLSYDDRKRLISRARQYRGRNPLAKQAAGILQHYVLGKGISLRANNRAKIARIIDEFWEDPSVAQVWSSHQAQKENLDSLTTDGDLFVVLFPDTEAGRVSVGLLDATFVEDVIPDRENAKIPRWYKVRKPDKSYDWRTGAWQTNSSTDFEYYRDWRNDEPAGTKGAPQASMIADGLVYHVAVNRRGGKFGESEYAAGIDWLKAHKDFMADRASLNRAAAQIAWKKKRKGGASDIAAEVARLSSTLVNSTSRYEGNPPPPSASTIVENEGSSLEWVKTDTGGQAASADERTLRMMAGSGMGGIPNHYFGDEASANLATATAMELPLLKRFEDYQTLWGDVNLDIVGFVLATAHEAGRIGERDDSARYAERATTPQKVLQTADVADDATTREAGAGPGNEKSTVLTATLVPKSEPMADFERETDSSGKLDWYVDIDFPPIVAKDLGPYITALKALYEMLPPGNIESQKLVVQMALNALGENAIDELMERLFPADADADALRNPPGTVNPADPTALVKALSGLIGKAGTDPAAAAGAGGAEAKVAESLAEYRVRRVLRAARQASDALAVVGA